MAAPDRSPAVPADPRPDAADRRKPGTPQGNRRRPRRQRLKMILQATGKKGVPQGGVISPLLSNLYLNEVDRMLEKAVDTTRRGKYTNIQYARFADDMVILIDAERRSDWLVKAVNRRLREEFVKLGVAINEDKSRMVDLKKGESFTFLGFEYRRIL